jgi:spermidine synthase
VVAGPAGEHEARGAGRERILYALAFLSGFAALVYQVSWARLLSLTFGSTTLAASAVVAGFMGGMGLGAWRLHRLEARVASPMRLYGLLEIGIALAAAAATVVIGLLPEAFARVAHGVPAGVGFDLLRIATVFALLLLPAALMGATYPALCLVLIRSSHGVERHLGAIYGINTVGAAVGALAAGIVAVERLGLRDSVLLANGVNLAVGATALALARGAAGPAGPARAVEGAPLAPSALPAWVAAVVLFGSGFATIAYEIVWLRALRYVVGNSTYALSVTLAVFLLGLGFGSLAFGPLVRRHRPERLLATTQLAVAVLALVAIAAEFVLLDVPSVGAGAAEQMARPWGWRLAFDGLLAACVMLPATLWMGLSFPLATRLLIGRIERLGARVGLSYLLANAGSIAGSVLGAVWILPAFGTVGGTRVLSWWSLALGLLVAVHLPAALRPSRALQASALGAALGLGLLLPARLPFRGADLAYLKGELVFEEEGDLATVQVRVDPKDPSRRGMLIDGTLIGVSGGWYYPIFSKQVVLAHLPMVLEPRIRSTLNVGLGSASTVAELAGHPEIERLDVVEISEAVVRGAEHFEAAAALRDPRVHVEVEDAIHFLLRGGEPYDLIVSDGKQNEDFSGTGKVLSVEFYRYALRRLSEHGLFVQALPIGMIHQDFAIVVRSLVDVFPEVEFFVEPPLTVYMVAGRQPIAERARLDPARFAALPASRALARLAYTDVDALLATWVASGPQVGALVGPGPRNDWDRLPLEFSAYRTPPAARGRAAADNLALLLRAREAAPSRARFVPAESSVVRARELAWQGCLEYLRGDRAAALRSLRRALAENPGDAWVSMVLRNFTRA